jgi:hypothetical protein
LKVHCHPKSEKKEASEAMNIDIEEEVEEPHER